MSNSESEFIIESTDSQALNTSAKLSSQMVEITTDGVPKLHCPVCSKGLASLNGYVNHVKKHEPPGGFTCRYCEERFCTTDALKQHREEKHLIIACRICADTTFSNENDYREHISIVHNGIDRQMYKCDKCSAEYKTIIPYNRHMETQCGTIRPHKCELCSHAFISKYNLKQHQLSHSGELKFCCSYCGKSFKQKGGLVEHERSHTGEKPYKCDVCGKAFAHRESLVTHSSIHTGVRLVECKCCQTRFSCYSNLLKHRRARPETCGLPEYNSTKRRGFTHRVRIPPSANPTSEIKVRSKNKILKPEEKAKNNEIIIARQIKHKKVLAEGGKKLQRNRIKKPKKEEVDPEATVVSVRGRKRKKLKTDAIEESINDIDLQSEIDNTILQSSSLKENGTTTEITLIEVKPVWNYSDSEEDFDMSNTIFSDDSDGERHSECPIKQESNEENSSVPYECSDEQEFIDISVKEEDVNSIFNQKDKLLDYLLNEDILDMEEAKKRSTLKQTIKTNQQKTDVMLQETEMILVDDPIDSDIGQDVLDTNYMNECKIMLEDITKIYPQLKEENSINIKDTTTANISESSTVPVEPQEVVSVQQTDVPIKKRRKRAIIENNNTHTERKRAGKLTTRELKARMRMLKKDQKTWQCMYCIKMYHMRKPFEKHLREDHKRPMEEVSEIFKSDNVATVTDEVYNCRFCNKMYLVEKRLKAHEKLHGENGKLTFKCPCYCTIYFATKEEATAHAQSEHREMLYCDLCKRFYTAHDSFKNHMRNHHSGKVQRCLQRNLVCEKCGKKFSGRTSLTDHVRSDCGRVPLYQCTVCGKHLTTAGILKTHMLLHSADKPFQCEQCGKTFKVKAQYNVHLKRHTDVKPYKCHLCPKEYPYRESLLTHMTIHTGIRRFMCQGCGKRFTCISNLQAHRKVFAETCGSLPLNTKATHYMGVKKGNLLLGTKPEAGLDYVETNTLIAKNVIRDIPPLQPITNFSTDSVETDNAVGKDILHDIPPLQPISDFTTTPTTTSPANNSQTNSNYSLLNTFDGSHSSSFQ